MLSLYAPAVGPAVGAAVVPVKASVVPGTSVAVKTYKFYVKFIYYNWENLKKMVYYQLWRQVRQHR